MPILKLCADPQSPVGGGGDLGLEEAVDADGQPERKDVGRTRHLKKREHNEPDVRPLHREAEWSVGDLLGVRNKFFVGGGRKLAPGSSAPQFLCRATFPENQKICLNRRWPSICDW